MISCSCLRDPSPEALRILRSPEAWACNTCGSTDGVWVCLHCGHVGCGRRAQHPLLGGGHALHHHFAAGKRHAVCVDAFNKTAWSHASDDWVIDEPPWLAALRAEGCASPLQLVVADEMPTPLGEQSITAPAAASGLKNLGNTCYMNATLQAMSHLESFRGFFRDFVKGETSSSSKPLTLGTVVITRQDTPAWKKQTESRAAQPLATALHGLLRVGWSGRYPLISPHAFVHTVWAQTELFEPPQQHDAQEFLSHLLGRLSEELGSGGTGVSPLTLPSGTPPPWPRARPRALAFPVLTPAICSFAGVGTQPRRARSRPCRPAPRSTARSSPSSSE